jgi:hypothetical protein
LQKKSRASLPAAYSINVWVGIIENHLTGAYILRHPFNEDGYLQFLNEVLPELLENISLVIRQVGGIILS